MDEIACNYFAFTQDVVSAKLQFSVLQGGFSSFFISLPNGTFGIPIISIISQSQVVLS
jgi:hypothetical protein